MAVMIIAALVGMAGGFWASKKLRPAAVSGSPRFLIDFTLTDRTGRSVTRAELTNQFLVVNFVATSCSVSCLQVNRHMARIQELVAGQSDVRLVSFTVDPRTDTPGVLAKFASQFGADTNRWLLLTGDKASLGAVVETSFLGRSADPAGSAMPGGFLHADQIAIVDPRGQVRAFFNGMKSGTPHDVTNTIASLRREMLKP
jgi:protein SCO1